MTGWKYDTSPTTFTNLLSPPSPATSTIRLARLPLVVTKTLSRVSRLTAPSTKDVIPVPSSSFNTSEALSATSEILSWVRRYVKYQREKSKKGWLNRTSPPRLSTVYSVKRRRLLKRSNPAESGRSKSHGSVNPTTPCWVLAPPRMRRNSSQPLPRKFRWERSSVPSRPSTEL